MCAKYDDSSISHWRDITGPLKFEMGHYGTLNMALLNVKVGFLYSAAYAMTGPARCTISEVAVDWQETMVLQRKPRPSNCTR